MAQSAAAYGSREIKLNDSGEDVRELQIKIVAFGDPEANVPCDGAFGRNSEKALENFCSYFGLKSRKVADSEIYLQIEKWVEGETEFLNVFKATFPCTCSGMSESRKPRALKMWKDKVKGVMPLASGGLADMPTCTGFGSGLTKAHKFPTGSIVGGGTVEFTEKPGFNKILLWATLGARKILKSKLNKSGLGMSINNGYRCQLKYFEILLQKFDADKMEEPVGIGNHIGNAIDLNISASTPKQARKILREANCFYETFDATENRVRLEPLDKSPRWTHIDTFTFKHQPYVTSVEDALAPRYTAGSATSPVVPPQGASQAPSGSGGEKGGGASSLDALLGYAENSKEWLQNSFSTFFDAYREGQIADAHDAIQADDGFFPIGKNLTWHGGIHAVGQPDGSVHAITDGVVVAARIPEKDPAKLSFGSRNFVLVKHQTPAGKPFWALYMHLRPIPLKNDDPKVAMLFPWLVRQKLKLTGGGGSNFRVSPDGEAGVLRTIGQGETLVSIEAKVVGPQKWIKAKADKDGLVGWLALTSRFEVKSEIDQLSSIQAGKVVNLNLPVKRGDCLGYMSPPKPGKKSFLHWEIFSDQVVSNQWLQVKDEDNDIVCDAVKFKELLNKSKAVTFFDSLTDSDIVAAYRDPKISAEIRKRAYFFKSEWSVEWKSALEKLKDDFEVDDLAPRLEPYNFWKEAEAAKCDIPKGGKVWHYRPPEFIAREFPAPKAQTVPESSTPATQNGNFTIIDKKAVVREASPPYKSTTETIPYFSKITVNSVSGEFATVQIGGAGAMKVTKKTNYVAFFKGDGMAPSVPVTIESGWSSSKKLTASTYNRLGGLLKAISDALGLEVAAAIAVWRVESGGKAHSPNQGIIRFENHHFWNFWGKNNAPQFDKSFTFGGHGTTTGKSYQGHKVSKDGGTTWSDFHGDQTKEYDVLNYASTFDKEAARKSISIGGCQIMISNHAICGYKTASEMYDAFQASEKSHVLGFFDFCKFCSGWHSGNDTMFNYAKAKDWVSFASKYNGPSNKDTYGALIETAYNEAKDVLS